MAVPMFVKHVDTSDEAVKWSNVDGVFVHDIQCAIPGFELIYTLDGYGTYANLPDGHTLYESSVKQTKKRKRSGKR